MTDWAAEREDVLARFMDELSKATGDGSKKRQSGVKPPWYEDTSHEAAIFSHLTKWKRGQYKDEDSGAHPLVHAAWRCLAIACRETWNVPNAPRCPAHGQEKCPKCSRNPNPDECQCGYFETYGMHWDTCPGRIR